MEDVDSQIKSLDNANALLVSNTELLPQILPQILSILLNNQEIKLLNWCLGFISNLLCFGCAFDIALRKQTSITICDTFVVLVSDSQYLKNKLLITQHPMLLKKFINISIDLLELSFSNVVDEDIDDEKSKDLWINMGKIKSFLMFQWNQKVPLAPLTEIDEDDESMVKNISTKLSLLKFFFKIIEIQAEMPQDPRKRRQRTIPKVCNDLQKLSTALIQDGTFAGEQLFDMTQESEDMLKFVMGLVVYKKNISCQILSAISFLLIKLLQKRSNYVRLVTPALIDVSFDDNFPVEKEMFTLNSGNAKDNFYRLKFKLHKRFSNRALKILIDYLFKNNHLNPYVQKEKMLSEMNEFEKLSSRYLDKINHLLMIQNEERTNKNLLTDLPHDYFKHIIHKVQQKQSKSHEQDDDYVVEPETELIDSYSSLFESVNDNPKFKFDLSTIPNNILVNLVLLSLDRAGTSELIHKLDSIGDRYVDIMEKAEKFPQIQENVITDGVPKNYNTINGATVNSYGKGNYKRIAANIKEDFKISKKSNANYTRKNNKKKVKFTPLQQHTRVKKTEGQGNTGHGADDEDGDDDYSPSFIDDYNEINDSKSAKTEVKNENNDEYDPTEFY
ncbi:hypothetical protein DASC09_018630 [Saccharomycopsis crataegensis]|uniref:Symplekin/Pta1 N-terminal domain-containing protein n=1 Tax=Saccharomycopsis crataegensis TaxID=43959 RepID=A0AAV5QIE2_9ASCO|nr:hypothetical protein DASC09_018630 [Saccharomycopsis crataegensis]